MNKNHPHLLAWCIGSFLLSTQIPFAGLALIPIYIVVERRRKIEANRIAALTYKYAFQARANMDLQNDPAEWEFFQACDNERTEKQS